MQFIPSDQISDGLRSLFVAEMPIGVRCLAILNGDATGRILADDAVHPTYAIVQEPGDGAIYMAGSLTAPILSEAIDLLRKDKDVVVGLWYGDPLWQLLPSGPEYDGAAIDFTHRPVGEGLSRFLRLPEGCRLQPIDHDLFQRLANYEWAVPMFGSAEKALEKGLGYCLMRDDAVLSEAFAGPFADGMIEIGTETHEPYRRRGYATITCAHLIRACEAKGYQTFWNAAKQNVASIALARKLGYTVEQEFRVLAWSKYRI